MLLTVILCFCLFSIHVAERRELGEFTVIHALTGWLPEVISLQYVPWWEDKGCGEVLLSSYVQRPNPSKGEKYLSPLSLAIISIYIN